MTRLAPSPDGRYLAVGDRRRTLRLVDLAEDGVEEMSGFGDGVLQVHWTSPRHLLALAVGAVSRSSVGDNGLDDTGPTWLEGHTAKVTTIGVSDLDEPADRCCVTTTPWPSPSSPSPPSPSPPST